MNTSTLNSLIALLSGVIVAVAPLAVPALQSAAASNPYVYAGLTLATLLYNHFVQPIHMTVTTK